ncbi:tRNA modification GTPase GTPBP3, mitochondrial, partial [Araneus ventricosus]
HSSYLSFALLTPSCSMESEDSLMPAVSQKLTTYPPMFKENSRVSRVVPAVGQKEVAIVSPTAGTTRDTLEFSLNIGGYVVNFCDTAGIRESSDSIEQEGVKRAKDRSCMADMLIFILEASRALELLSSSNTHNTNELVPKLLSKELGESYLKSIMANQSEETVKALILLNKIDLLSNEELVK